MKIKNFKQLTIFFDIGDVIVNSKKLIRDSVHFAANKCSSIGFNIDPNLIESSYLEIDKNTKRPHLNHLFADREILLTALEKIEEEKDLRYAGTFLTYYRTRLRHLLRPKKEMASFFFEMSQLPYFQFGIISDGTTDDQLEILTRLKIIQYLNGKIILISQEVGMEKTSKDIYLECLRRSNTRPEHTFMVGDNTERDIIYPKQLGMRTIFFTKYIKIKNQKVNMSDFSCKNFLEIKKVLLDYYKSNIPS